MSQQLDEEPTRVTETLHTLIDHVHNMSAAGFEHKVNRHGMVWVVKVEIANDSKA